MFAVGFHKCTSMLEGHTANEAYYCALLSDWLRPAIRSNWPEMLQKDIIFKKWQCPTAQT